MNRQTLKFGLAEMIVFFFFPRLQIGYTKKGGIIKNSTPRLPEGD